MKVPRHLAIIMDGNGRWAQARGHHRIYGHARGASVARKVIEECSAKGIANLTLFTFSTENWFRPTEEVTFLMRLLARHLQRETQTLLKNNIRFRCIGDLGRLPTLVRARVEDTIARTSHCTGMNLTFALSYGGRQELVRATQTIAAEVARGELSPESIDEATIASRLESSFLPDPDLIIRTSGEHRLSNFFLWQAAYAEFFVMDRPWPEFSVAELDQALRFFDTRQRRYGRTPEQLTEASATPT